MSSSDRLDARDRTEPPPPPEEPASSVEPAASGNARGAPADRLAPPVEPEPSDTPEPPDASERSGDRARSTEPAPTTEQAPGGPCAEGSVSRPAGLAHVCAISFLAARASPAGAFVLALAGGVALARAGERSDWRSGYGASLAAMVQTVAYLGPARVNGPLTQAITAPGMGALERRGVGALGQWAACAGGRLVHNALASAFFVFVLIGGLDAYAGTWDETFGALPVLPSGVGGALGGTGVLMVAWAVSASAVQLVVYRRGLRRWPEAAVEESLDEVVDEVDLGGRGRFDPRAVAVAATIAFVLLIASTAAPLLAAVAVWLALAWGLSRPDRRAVPVGLALALLLGGGSLVFSLIGGLGLEVGLRRGARAMLLVLVATWLRAAARSGGIREVARRSLGRLRRVPAVPEAVAILDELGAEARLGPSGRALIGALGSSRKRPVPMVDAVLGWVAGESHRFRARLLPPPVSLRLTPRDGALVAAAALPAAALILA